MRTLTEIGFTILCLCAALCLGYKGAMGIWDMVVTNKAHDGATPLLMALAGVVLVRIADSWSPSRGLVGY